MSQRVKGQENEIVLLQDGAPKENFSFIRSSEFTYLTEILEEGYLGETTNRYDTVFKGVRGNLECHFDNPVVFDVIQAVIDKARRRTPGTRFNIKSTLKFPSGRRARVIHQDVEFGNLPIKFGSRTDYGTFAVPFACSNSPILPA